MRLDIAADRRDLTPVSLPSSWDASFRAEIERDLAALETHGKHGERDDIIAQALIVYLERELVRTKLDALIDEGIESADAGDVEDADAVFDRLDTRLRAMIPQAA